MKNHVLTLISCMVRPMALAALWTSFAVPLGAVPITYVHAFGLLLLASIFRGINTVDIDRAFAPGWQKPRSAAVAARERARSTARLSSQITFAMLAWGIGEAVAWLM